MILGDKRIHELIDGGYIESSEKIIVNPASINVRLGTSFLVHRFTPTGIRLGEKVHYELHQLTQDGEFCLLPDQFALATTMEKIILPQRVAAFVQGRSSIGRAGLSVQNAGFIDPGFYGHITLELKNETKSEIYLTPGYPIAQIIFMETTSVKKPYAGKYNGQIEATGTRMELDRADYGIK